MVVIFFHLWHGLSSAAQSLGIDHPTGRRASSCWAGCSRWSSRRLLPSSDRHLLHFAGRAMTLDSKIPSGPISREVGPPQVREEAGQPGQPAQVRRHRRRHRPGRRVGGRVARRARLQREAVRHPRQPAPRPQHRRAGRHQRRQELPERRRQRLPAVLRHGQGRRLPRPRGQRLPPGAGLGRASSTSASRRACRSRASTAACSTTARSAARRCRAPSTPAARPASNCCSAPTSR